MVRKACSKSTRALKKEITDLRALYLWELNQKRKNDALLEARHRRDGIVARDAYLLLARMLEADMREYAEDEARDERNYLKTCAYHEAQASLKTAPEFLN